MVSGSTWQGKGKLVIVDIGSGKVQKLTQACVLVNMLGQLTLSMAGYTC